jgi:hypothetical protein
MCRPRTNPAAPNQNFTFSGYRLSLNRGAWMPGENRTAELKVRIRPSLKAAVDRAADNAGRSVSNLTERLLEEAVKETPAKKQSNRRNK